MYYDYPSVLKDIEFIKNKFQESLKEKLGLVRVSAPLFVTQDSGLNDDLSGTERKVNFRASDGTYLEIVQSLAKWKRYALDKYHLQGIYADMNAIRQDEVVDNIHSIYVDQWDWEHVITKEERNIETLQNYVNNIFQAIKQVDKALSTIHPDRKELLKGIETVKFFNLDYLKSLYPHIVDQKELENTVTKQFNAVFIIGISEDRAPDYDDWMLNGDLIVWNPVLNSSLELSSMGIRVNSESLEWQLKARGLFDSKKDLFYHSKVLNNEFPLTIGGGIGQSRLCMYLLQLPNIAQVQVSYIKDSVLGAL